MSAPPNAPLSPPGLEHDDRGPALRAFIIVMVVFSCISVILRFWSRLLHPTDGLAGFQQQLWWDDWMVLAALVG